MKSNKKKETIEIPMPLARMLVVRPEDLKEGAVYEDVQELAKALLRVLIAAE